MKKVAKLFQIQTRRVYDDPSVADGMRFLVDRLWPRGIKREDLRIDGWLKDAAPSNALRRSFAHQPQHWHEFRGRYFAELDANPAAWGMILEALRGGPVTLVYAARDREHNNAAALRDYLLQRSSRTGSKSNAVRRPRV